MELSPKAIAGVEFRIVRRGYDPDEVRSFLVQVGKGVEEMRAQLVATDNRARAAMAKLQELSSAAPVAPAAPAPAPVAAPTPAPAVEAPREATDADTITRTLVLAQKTADAAVAEAQERARTIVAEAEAHAKATLADADRRAAAMVADAETKSAERVRAAENDARRQGEAERTRVVTELQELASRRDRLRSDAENLAGHVTAQRSRVSAAVEVLQQVLQHPEGLTPIPVPASLTTDIPNPPVPDLSPRASAPAADPLSLVEPTPSRPVTASIDHEPAPRSGFVAEVEDEFDIGGDLAALAPTPGQPITAEVPAMSGDDRHQALFDLGSEEDVRWRPESR
jgi:DivIVA domain-containing protein